MYPHIHFLFILKDYNKRKYYFRCRKQLEEFYNCYNEIEKYWKQIFKDEIYTIEYEALISDSVKQIKNLIKFCELEWDENCLKHYNNKSPINTASINQVRKPIYNSSMNLFKKYSVYFDINFENLIKN